jgi:transcriptional regulator with XRE-family HTH domain
MEDIGQKIKALRLAKQMTLKTLAGKAGCTSAYISQLERGLANPSVMILKKIAAALQIKVVDFFLEPEANGGDIVTRCNERVTIDMKEGDLKMEMLVRSISNRRMQPFYTTIEPGGGSKGAYSHVGEECGLVLEGELKINFIEKSYLVRRGESFYYSSQEPHHWFNPGKKKTVVIWVVSPPTF